MNDIVAAEPAPIELYRLITTGREVFDIAADSYSQDLAGSAGWFYFSIAGKVVFQVLAAQVFVILVLFDELEGEDEVDDVMDNPSVAAAQAAEEAEGFSKSDDSWEVSA